MPSSEESGTPRLNVWTLEEFSDLVIAWDLAVSRPRDSSMQTLHDAVYKHFVARRGGFTRRNKAALTSKRSALKFSYLFVRDFNTGQKLQNEKLFFDLSEVERYQLMTQWKKQNSSVIELTPDMFKILGRIITKGGEEEPSWPRIKDQQEAKGTVKMETRPTRASAAPSDGHATSISMEKTTINTKKQTATARSLATSNPWSSDEMMKLVKAWGTAAHLVCESPTGEPMSIVHEMYRQFQLLQGGKIVRNLSGLATRRRVLKQSYSKIVAFNKIQEMNGNLTFTELSTTERQNLIRSWKNANVLDLSEEIYSELDKIIPLDTRAVALEDMRRANAGTTSNSGNGRANRKPGRPPKKQKASKLTRDSNDEETFSLQPYSGVDDSEEEKAFVIPRISAHRRTELDNKVKTADQSAESVFLTQQNHSRVRTEGILARQTPSISANRDSSVMLDAKPDVEGLRTIKTTDSAGKTAKSTPVSFLQKHLVQSGSPIAQLCAKADSFTAADGENGIVERLEHPALHRDRKAKPVLVSSARKKLTSRSIFSGAFQQPEVAYADDEDLGIEETGLSVCNQDHGAIILKPRSDVSKVDHNENVIANATPTNNTTDPAKHSKKKRKLNVDGPNGHLWENKELQILINAWEKAAIIVCNSAPADRLSLNREMYREFVEVQGGKSMRNSTALAARRSSLKFSYAHIQSFNESQKAKGEPSYHEISEDTRMTLLRSWKNRNSVDLTKEMYDGLGRILAMDEKLAKVRSLRPPPVPKPKKKEKSSMETNDSDTNHGSKMPKWTTEESSDLIKACADVMNVHSDKKQSATEREEMIYDAFVARRQNAGDTDTPIRRDLRSMAQQWRHILASYSYIKECNDNRSEGESSSWFDMSAVQKRAYQHCTNVPAKFVDLDAEMFALVTETSFVEEVEPPLPLSDIKGAAEGISLRPRSTRKRTEAFWSSDSESSVNSKPIPSAKRASKKDSKLPAVKKGNNWPIEEVWNLVQAWEEASRVTESSRLTSALGETFTIFTNLQEGPPNRNRTVSSVRNKMIALKSSFTRISNFIVEIGDSSGWFDMPPEQRLIEIRSWNNKTIVNLDKDMYNALEQILSRKKDGTQEKPGKRKSGKPKKTGLDTKTEKEQDKTGHTGQKHEKCVVANWSKEELLMLGEACGELLEGRRSRRYVFEEEKDRFFRRYEELGGTNSLSATVGLARFVLDSYEFIYFYNQKAAETNCFSWFELSAVDRDSIVSRIGKAHRSFNGLSTVDEDIFDVIDRIDAELRVKLGETKKKTYKPPNDAASSRYVDIEAVVERCFFRKRKHSASKKAVVREVPVQLEELSDGEADLSSSESSLPEESGSDSSAPVRVKSHQLKHSDEDSPTHLPRHRVVPRRSKAIHKRKRGAGIDGSTTLYITEIIQKQNRQLEEAVKRFRKDSADARKEHHAFLVQKIQDSFPVDTGNGSYLERVADRQGQTLVEIFQRLQQQRDAEKAKDDELMRQLFSRVV
ncbi:unnamed protein product [Peronospora effusa]|nr:unnamed protein product [Peronospora effusa]